MIEIVTDWLRSLRYAAGRISLIPLLVRVSVFLAALAGLALAVPVDYLNGRPLALLGIVALVPSFSPRRIGPTVAILAPVAGWLLATTVFERPIGLWRLLALAVALYLVHSLCALAAFLPYDGVVDPAVVTRWLVRAVVVALVAAMVGVALLLLVGRVDAGTGLGATVLGLAITAGVAALLGWLVRRP